MSKKVIYGGAVGAVILVVGLLAWLDKVTWNDFGVAFLALLGTFFGALFAFRLDQGKEAAKELARRKSALNRALVVLGAQHNEVRIIKRELEKFPDPRARAFSMNATMPVHKLGLEQKIDDLDFLLDSEDPNMLFKLHIEQLRFDQALEAVRMRARHCADVLQPAMGKNNLQGTMMNEQRLRQVLGDMVFETAINSTGTMAHHIKGSDESIPALAQELRALAKKIIPGEKFVQFTSVDPKPQFDPRTLIH